MGTGRKGDGKRIYRGRWDTQGGNWQAGRREEEFTVGSGRQGDGKRNLPQEMGHPRWELAGRETGRGIYRRRWDIRDIQGRRIYHMTWDFQGRNWQAGRREEEFTT